MDFIIGFVLELLLEGSIEVSSNKKISKWIRYPILAILVLFFSIVIFGLIMIGVFMIPQNMLGGIFITAVGLFMLIMFIFQFRKKYLEVVSKK